MIFSLTVINSGIMPTYYTQSGEKIRDPEAYALTGAPMFKTKYSESKDINTPTTIYKLNLEDGKKYVGKTTNFDRRMDQHFSGNGAKVTKKFKPVDGKTIDEVPGFFSDEVEQECTKDYIKKYGYDKVRGGSYTNSHTFKKTNGGKPSKKQVVCFKCGNPRHYANQCYVDNEASDESYSDDY